MRFLLVALIFTSCAAPTMTPERVSQSQASFEGNVQNSGLLGYDQNGFNLTDAAMQRYKDLCETFDSEVIGVSVIDGKNYLTKEGMVQFMNLTDRRNNK